MYKAIKGIAVCGAVCALGIAGFLSGTAAAPEAKAAQTVYGSCVEWAPTEESLLKTYMGFVGYEYEDTLMVGLSEQYDCDISIEDCADITLEELEHRSGSGEVIVERCIGKVLNENLDGVILDAPDAGNYISYRSYSGNDPICEGTLMITYLVYNPETNYCDDIIDRYDCVVSHALEK